MLERAGLVSVRDKQETNSVVTYATLFIVLHFEASFDVLFGVVEVLLPPVLYGIRRGVFWFRG